MIDIKMIEFYQDVISILLDLFFLYFLWILRQKPLKSYWLKHCVVHITFFKKFKEELVAASTLIRRCFSVLDLIVADVPSYPLY